MRGGSQRQTALVAACLWQALATCTFRCECGGHPVVRLVECPFSWRRWAPRGEHFVVDLREKGPRAGPGCFNHHARERDMATCKVTILYLRSNGVLNAVKREASPGGLGLRGGAPPAITKRLFGRARTGLSLLFRLVRRVLVHVLQGFDALRAKIVHHKAARRLAIGALGGKHGTWRCEFCGGGLLSRSSLSLHKALHKRCIQLRGDLQVRGDARDVSRETGSENFALRRSPLAPPAAPAHCCSWAPALSRSPTPGTSTGAYSCGCACSGCACSGAAAQGRRPSEAKIVISRLACATCGKLFSGLSGKVVRASLSRHRRTHRLQPSSTVALHDLGPGALGRRWVCAACARTFSDAGSLARHAQTHAPASARPFRCAHCGARPRPSSATLGDQGRLFVPDCISAQGSG